MKFIVATMIAVLTVPLNLAAAGMQPNPQTQSTYQVGKALEALERTPLQDRELNRLKPEDLEELGYEDGSFKKTRLKTGMAVRNFQRKVNRTIGVGSIVGGVVGGALTFLTLKAIPIVGVITLISYAVAPEKVGPVVRKGWNGTVNVVKETARYGVWAVAAGALHLTTFSALTFSMKRRIFIDLLAGKSPEAKLLKWNPVDKKSRVAKVVIDNKDYFLIETAYTGKRFKWADIIGRNSPVVTTSLYKFNQRNGQNPKLDLISNNEPIGDSEDLRLRFKGVYVLEAGEATLIEKNSAAPFEGWN